MTAPSYHLTPRSLVGQRSAPDVFGGVRVALVGFCPPPAAFSRYHQTRLRDQHFIHVSPDTVRLVSHGGHRFLSLAHVYGGPVSSATVEELAYYGVDTILAYGLAGALGVEDLGMGGFYVVASALAADGTTPHYTSDPVVQADPELLRHVENAWCELGLASLRGVRAATGDAIYRESDAMLDGFRANGCHIVNLDSAHLYAASVVTSEGRRLRTVQCGVVSDVVEPGGRSECALATMLAGGATELTRLELTGTIVRFYIETLAPQLLEP